MASLFIAGSSFGQKAPEGIDQRVKDPKTAENAAKADVYIIRNNKNIDSLQQNTAAPAERKKTKKEKRGCRKKKK